MTRPLDICLVTCDIVGPIRNGGIGTAYYSLAHALRRDGHKVTVLYAAGRYSENGPVEQWVAEYQRHGIKLVPLPDTDVQGHPSIKMAAGVYRWLKTRRFDIVHYHEWRGIGAYLAAAKHQGLAFQNTVLVAGTHSPTLWHLEGMREMPSPEAIEVDFLERQSVRHADVLWSPSRHMLQWLRREKWTLPKRIVLKQYVLLEQSGLTGRPSRKAHGPSPELVFFGRLETRKGIDVFCDALDRLVAAGTPPAAVTFLGKLSTINGQGTADYLQQRSEKWPFAWQIKSHLDRNGAMAYLRKSNRVAVLPSRIDNLPYTVLECLGSGIPFVASDTGGIPEMIRTADRQRVLFSLTPASMAERLSAVVANGQRPVLPRISVQETIDGWLNWHREVAVERPSASADTPATRARMPLVSVVVTTHNRPAFLRHAIDSLKKQDYKKLEVVIVDDGSTHAMAQQALTEIEKEIGPRGWKVVRQENRYLGAARNAGVSASKGDYVLFMDDDNLAEPHEVSTFVRVARATGADVLTCFLAVYQGARARADRKPTFTWPFLGGAAAAGVVRNVFGDANCFVRREVLTATGGFSEDVGISGEDWEFLARAVLHGFSLEVIPESLVRYRQSPQGMLHTTSPHANHLRALRPYLSSLPAHLRGLAQIGAKHATSHSHHGSTTIVPTDLDHVQRAVVFGSGAAGRMAINLAKKCGWDVGWICDNNPSMWNRTAHDLPVRAPASLTTDPFDLVIVASLAGKAAISKQLAEMGLAAGEQFVHFLDPVRVGNLTYQLSLP